MPVRPTSTQRALLTGVTAAGLLIGAFAAGAAQGGDPAAAATASGHTLAVQPGTAGADGASGAKITVTGTGAVSGTPDQLLLSMGVQTSDASVSAALQRASHAVRAVTAALARSGVRRSDIQTSGMSIQPQYGNSALPTGYGVSESIAVTLRRLATAGTQISDAVRAGGNATEVDGVSLNVSDASSLLAAARARAVADARTKAAQYARALGRSVGPVVSMSEQGSAEPLPVIAPGAARSSATPSPVPVAGIGRPAISIAAPLEHALAGAGPCGRLHSWL
jgi:uncharacterized protein YggE